MKSYENKKKQESSQEFECHYLKTLSENISKIRHSKGITLPMLSDATGISINYLAKVSSNSEKTKRIPTLNVLLKISYALGCSPLALFFTNNEEIEQLKDIFNEINI